jgi:hypothetical protein
MLSILSTYYTKQDCIADKLRLQEENRQLRLQLAAAQLALTTCGQREGEDLLHLEEEAVALGLLVLMVVGGLASMIARACWYRSRHADFPLDR